MTRSSIIALGLAAPLVLITSLASAQAPAPPPPAPPPPAPAPAPLQVKQEYTEKPDFKPVEKRKQGWDPSIAVGGTLAFANNSSVVGQVDGSTFSFGIKLDAGLNLNHGSHEWRNTLGVVAGTTRTPAVDQFVKTSDLLAFDSIYLYHVVPWFGPFVRFSVNTQMFRGSDVRAGNTPYQISDADGKNPATVCGVSGKTIGADGLCSADDPNVLPGTASQQVVSKLSLSDPFKPTTLKQSIGLFVQPYAKDPLTIELRAGLGAQETFADSQLAVKDDATTANKIEVVRLTNANLVGAELGIAAWGKLVDNRVSYRLEGNFLTPFIKTNTAANTGKSAVQLTTIQLAGTLSFKLVEWASLDYNLRLFRDPSVLDAFQVQNTLFLTFGIAYPTKAIAPQCPACAPLPPPKPAEAPPPAQPAAPPPAQPVAK